MSTYTARAAQVYGINAVYFTLAVMNTFRALTFCFALAIPQLSPAKSPNPKPIESAVSALVTQFSDGIAVSYPEFGHVLWGNVFGSESADAVAFFNIEAFGGSNYHAEYVAFFAAVSPDSVAGRKTRPFRLVAVAQIGGRGWRTFNWENAVLKPSELRVSGKRWREEDAACCASEPITITFRVVNGSIVEVK